MTRIVLSIDRLVLHGVAPGDARALTQALQAQLQTLLAGGEAELLRQGSAHALPPARLQLPAGADAATLGRAAASHIARAPAASGKTGQP